MRVERQKLWTHKFLICNEEQGKEKEVIWGIKNTGWKGNPPTPFLPLLYILLSDWLLQSPSCPSFVIQGAVVSHLHICFFLKKLGLFCTVVLGLVSIKYDTWLDLFWEYINGNCLRCGTEKTHTWFAPCIYFSSTATGGWTLWFVDD